MNADRALGTIYGLLDAYKYVARNNPTGRLVPHAVLDSLIGHQTLPPTCVPRVCFGPLVSAAIAAALFEDLNLRTRAYTRAAAHMTLDAHTDALELVTAFGEACHAVTAMPASNTDPETFLTRFFYTCLGPDNQRILWGTQTWMAFPPDNGPWLPLHEHTLHRFLAHTLLVLARFAGAPSLPLLQLHLDAQRPHSDDLVSSLHAAACTVTLAAVCGAKLGAYKTQGAFHRAISEAVSELLPGLLLPRDGFFCLTQLFV